MIFRYRKKCPDQVVDQPSSTGISRRAVLQIAAQTLVAAPVMALSMRDVMAQSATPADATPADVAAANAAHAKLRVITKAIPSTGQRIPAIGIGTNAFKAENYAELKATLQRMYQLGGTVIDTANDYGDSEGVIGQSLAELKLRKKMFVVTKCNEQGFDAAWAPPGVIYGKASFARSLQRLQTDRVELMYAHHLPSVEPLMPWLRELKKTGKTRYIGIGTPRQEEQAQLVEQMRRHPIDFIEVNYSLGDRDAAATVFPVAVERKIAVTAVFPLGGRRGSLFKQVGDRPLPPWAADIDVTSWSQFFLKYVISHPAVTCAVPGSTNVEHLVDNQLAAHGRLPDAAMRKRMEEYWDAIT